MENTDYKLNTTEFLWLETFPCLGYAFFFSSKPYFPRYMWLSLYLIRKATGSMGKDFLFHVHVYHCCDCSLLVHKQV